MFHVNLYTHAHTRNGTYDIKHNYFHIKIISTINIISYQNNFLTNYTGYSHEKWNL